MNGNFTLGHACIYPPTTQTTIPYLHGLRLARNANRAGQTLRTIAASDEEFEAVCQFLARRRSKLGRHAGGKGKAVSNRKGKQNPDLDIL